MSTELTIFHNTPVISSRAIAQEINKRHSDILASLEKILANGDFRSLILPSEYADLQGKPRKEYLLTKDGFTLYMFNIQGYNDFKMAYINKFNEFEEKIKNSMTPQIIPQDYSEALRMLADKIDENEKLRQEVIGYKTQGQQMVLDIPQNIDDKLEEKTYLASEIAKMYGMGVVRFNITLLSTRIIKRIRSGYTLTKPNRNKGYTEKLGDCSGSLRWTEKGLRFIHKKMSKLGYNKIEEEL